MPFGKRLGTGGFILMTAASLTILGSATRAGATTLRRMDLPELVAAADRVVHARVVENRSWVDTAASQIYTDTVVDVLDDAKGSGPSRLTITQLGGRSGLVDMVVDGTPTFSVGEEVILFTELHSNGRRLISGLSQGVMRVHEDPQTGEKIAIAPAITGVEIVGGKGHRLEAPIGKMMDQIRQLAASGHKSSLQKSPAKDPVKPGGGQR